MSKCEDCGSTSGPFTRLWPDSLEHVSADQIRDVAEAITVCEDIYGCDRRVRKAEERDQEARMRKWRRTGSAWA